MLYFNMFKLILFLAIITAQLYCIVCQSDFTPVEVIRCAQYKRDVYEMTSSYSALVRGAQVEYFTLDTCDAMSVPLIVGGEPASSKEFPFMARIGHLEADNINWFCGGTLLSEKFVLTAAHCFYTPFGIVNRVRLGEVNVNENGGQPRTHEDFGVRRYINLSNYNFDYEYNDIGLIELDGSVNFNEYKHPACLPQGADDEVDDLIAIGWGGTSFVGPQSDVLRKVKLMRFSNDRCSIPRDNRSPYGFSESTQLCAGSDVRKDTCQGDSGGPLLAFHSSLKCMYTVVGITSFGSGCGTPGKPAFYTKVTRYLDWIRSIVWA